jgi:hypothetical protein
MTWGTDCSMCGREDCAWVAGKYCEGNSARAPEGFRVRFGR